MVSGCCRYVHRWVVLVVVFSDIVILVLKDDVRNDVSKLGIDVGVGIGVPVVDDVSSMMNFFVVTQKG